LNARANIPPNKYDGGFDILLPMADMVVRVGSVLSVLAAQVWWAALLILTFSVPLCWLAVRSGKANYAASKEAGKHNRRRNIFKAC
jgi:ATP-binding cassette subfamily B protein